MKLKNVEIEIPWKDDSDVRDLRNFVVSNFPRDLEVVRWSINEVHYLDNNHHKKILMINALFLN